MNPSYILSDFSKKQGYDVESYESVDSTNLVAQKKAKLGHPGFLWIVAEKQTEGRARRGRVWSSPKGNLYTSLLLIDDIVHKTAAQLGFVAGISVVEAIKTFIKDERQACDIVGLKWPNDILLGGAKSAGILLESFRLDSEKYALVIGIGVNVKYPYEGAPYLTSSMKNIDLDIDRKHLFTCLTEYFAKNYLLWKQSGGSDAIRKKWLSFAAYLGENIKVIDDKKVIEGVFESLDCDFNCIVKQKDGQKAIITAADVHFGTVSSFNAGV